MCTAPRYLLIVACSQSKCVTPGVLPALKRYDGAYFRVLRKARREGYWPEKLDVLIVSAKYGLLEADTPIAHHDVRMTREQATRLRPCQAPSHQALLAGLGEVSISRFVRVSRPTVDAWIPRFESEHFAGLVDRSRAPKAPARKVGLLLMVQV